MITRVLPAALAAFALAGCADRIAERSAELSTLVGKPEAEVVQTIGVPTRTYETGGIKFLAYDRHRVDYDPGLPGFGYGYGFGYGFGGPFGFYGGGFPPTVYNDSCETTFQVRAGVVQSFDFRGNACGSLAPMAARIIPVPPAAPSRS